MGGLWKGRREAPGRQAAPCPRTGGLQPGARRRFQAHACKACPSAAPTRSFPPRVLLGVLPGPGLPHRPPPGPAGPTRAPSPAQPSGGSRPARAPRRHARREGRGGGAGSPRRGSGTGRDGAGRKAPRAWQLCPPRESRGRRPPGLAGACALLFLPPFPSSAGWVSALLLPWGGGE